MPRPTDARPRPPGTVLLSVTVTQEEGDLMTVSMFSDRLKAAPTPIITVRNFASPDPVLAETHDGRKAEVLIASGAVLALCEWLIQQHGLCPPYGHLSDAQTFQIRNDGIGDPKGSA